MITPTPDAQNLPLAANTAPPVVQPPEVIVATRGLTRRYGRFVALSDLNLDIEKGSIYGFIGPNGAGKTTTMRILATLLEPSAGQAWVAGYPVVQAPYEVRKRIGYMPDFFGVYDNMKVWEYLDFFATAYHVPTSRRKGLIEDLLALVDLSAKKNSFVEELSRGMKQRLCLARTLTHEPELLILDEPASGLDPHARIELRELLKELRSLGKTILVSSHILSELAELCTHVAIIERGRLLVSGRVGDIIQKMQPAREIYIRVMDRAPEAAVFLQTTPGVLSVQILPAGYRPGMAILPDPMPAVAQPQIVPPNPPNPTIPPPPAAAMAAQAVPQGPATLYVRVNGSDAALSDILSRLVGRGIPVFGFEEAVGNLEDIFLRTTKGLVQ